MSSTVQIIGIDGQPIGSVVVTHDADAEPAQIANSARLAVAGFVVAGETFTVAELKEWSA